MKTKAIVIKCDKCGATDILRKVCDGPLDIAELLYLIIKERAEVLSDMLVSGDNDIDTINDGYNIKDILED